jgi:hypothetical protein
MTSITLSPKMLGYWNDQTLREVPDESGIFCVLRAGPDPSGGDTVVRELLYIGEHRDVRYRIEHHEDRARWQACLKEGEALWYSVGLCGYVNRERLEAAMVHAHKPPLNRDYLDTFPFDETTVHLYGKRDKLLAMFTLQRRD